MHVYTLDPLHDPRWDELVVSHPNASIFHQVGWLRALEQTYGYQPIAITTSPPGERLTDGMVFCNVQSRLTGNRLVSIPFSDHAEPLLNDDGDCSRFAGWIEQEHEKEKWEYIEVRPLSAESCLGSSLSRGQSLYVHRLDLWPSVDELFRRMHKSCVQRRIRHAERQNLSYERGCSQKLFREFYELLLMTKRRNRALPQPRTWFLNLMTFMRPHIDIRVARKDGRPIAATFALRHNDSVICKYSCSDAAFHRLCGTPFLFWKMIQEGRAEGAHELDFGRTDAANSGMIRFMDRFGTIRKPLDYLRDVVPKHGLTMELPVGRAAGAVSSILPGAAAATAGEIVYRHIG